MIKFLLFWVLIIFLLSCNRRSQDDILLPGQMQDLLWEQMQINAYTVEYLSKDSSLNPEKENLILQEKIFQKYHTTKDQFYRSYNYYLEHSVQMREMLDSIGAKQARLHNNKKLNISNKRKSNE